MISLLWWLVALPAHGVLLSDLYPCRRHASAVVDCSVDQSAVVDCGFTVAWGVSASQLSMAMGGVKSSGGLDC